MDGQASAAKDDRSMIGDGSTGSWGTGEQPCGRYPVPSLRVSVGAGVCSRGKGVWVTKNPIDITNAKRNEISARSNMPARGSCKAVCIVNEVKTKSHGSDLLTLGQRSWRCHKTRGIKLRTITSHGDERRGDGR